MSLLTFFSSACTAGGAQTVVLSCWDEGSSFEVRRDEPYADDHTGGLRKILAPVTCKTVVNNDMSVSPTYMTEQE